MAGKFNHDFQHGDYTGVPVLSSNSIATKRHTVAGIETIADDADLMSYLSGGTFDNDVASSMNDFDDLDSDEAESIGLVEPFEVDNREDRETRMRPLDVLVVQKPSTNRGNSHSKNAVNARENRQRKKRYMAGLEQTVKHLSEENTQLKLCNKKQEKSIRQLQSQNNYLRNVLQNQSVLSDLLQNVQNTPGVKFMSRMSVESDAINSKAATPAHSQEVDQTEVTSTEKTEDLLESSKLQARKIVHTTVQVTQSDTHYCNLSSTQTGDKSRRENIVNGIFTALGGAGSATCRDVIEIDDNSDTVDETDNELDSLSAADAGICLHVSGQRVSVEFCSSCNRSSVQTCTVDHSYYKPRE